MNGIDRGRHIILAGAFLVAGTGLRFIARADRAPDSKGVTLSDQFDRNAGFGSVRTDHGTCTAKPDKRLITCSFGNLNAGEAATITLVVKPEPKGSFTNTASASLASPTDPNLANNTSSKTVTVLP